MLASIQKELAKLIAQEVLNYAKQLGSDIERDLNQTNLMRRGGLPEAVLAMFEKSFLETLDEPGLQTHGSGFWRIDGSEREFEFMISSRIVNSVNHRSDWVAAAKRTNEGVRQLGAFSSEEHYRDAIATSMKTALPVAVNACRGVFRKLDYGNDLGWLVLTPQLTVPIARKGTTEFSPENIFYLARGTKVETKSQYKMAKRLIVNSWFRKATQPSSGPYYK